MITVRFAGHNRMTLWDGDTQVGRECYTDYYTAAYDLGGMGRPMPDDWRDITRAVQGYAEGWKFWRSLRPSAVEMLARRMENDRWLHQSPRMVRAFALHRLQHAWLHKLIMAGPDARVRKYRKAHPRAAAKKVEEVELAAIAAATEAMRRRRALSLRWLTEVGFPWPEDVPV